MTTIYLVEVEAIDDGGSAAWLYAAGGRGYVSAPADSPANTIYRASLKQPGLFSRHLWRPGTTLGRGSVSTGAIELSNADGFYDFARLWDFDGRTLRILRGDDAAARSTFSALFVGTIDRVVLTRTTLAFRLRDRMGKVAEKLVVNTRFAGNNALPAGAEGTASDLKGLPKPWLIGQCENIEPPRVNTTRWIYQISNLPIQSITYVASNGAAVTAGASRANLAALQSSTPTAGTFNYSLGSGSEGAYIRLGSDPGANVITAHAVEGANAAARTVGQCVKRVLLAAGVDAGDIASMTTIDAAAPGEVGYWAPPEETTVGDVVDALARSVGAAWAPTKAGVFQLVQLTDPVDGTTPVADFVDADLIEDGGGLQLLATNDAGLGVPNYLVQVDYYRNWRPMTGSEVAAAVTSARREWLGQEWRSVTDANTAIWDPSNSTGRNPTSQPLRVQSLLLDPTQAANEAARLKGLYAAKRVYMSAPVRSSRVPDALDLGKVYTITSNRFGMSSGKRLRLVGVDEDWATGKTTLFGWG